MSAILLSNPYVPPTPAHGQHTDAAYAPVMAPTPGVSAGSASGDTTAFSGSGNGSGASKQAENAALLLRGQPGSWSRPADATGRSVIGAQASENDNALGPNLPDVPMPDPLPTSPFLKRGDD